MSGTIPKSQDESTDSFGTDVNHLMQEQRRRWEAGTPILVEAILAKHPALRNNKEALLDLINHEIVLCGEFAKLPTREEYLGRFPDLKTDLVMLFEVQDAIAAKSVRNASTIDAEESDAEPRDALPSPPNYEVVGVLGEGGMGIVYKAIDLRLKRLVALKMIRTSRAGTAERLRFQREAEAVAKLDHPGIVHIYDIGEFDGQPFFALEYLDGGSLSSLLKGLPQAPIASARLVETLAQSVHYAHSHGIIHRDLKPGNVLLAADGRQQAAGLSLPADGCLLPATAKIADFGLAKEVENNSDATQTQAIVGTPSYMAPEQAGDFSRRIGPPADVYSLGAILYELLTGRPPFRGETVLDTLDQVRTQDPIPPSRLQPKLPRDLETICLKCLRKDPAQRYPTAEALADDLARFLRHEPIQARPTSAFEKLRLWYRRHPAQAALYGTVLLVAFIGFPLVTYLWLETLASNARFQAQLYDFNIKLAQRYWRENQIDQLEATLESLRPMQGERDLRDFEWRYLWNLLHQESARVPADGCLAFGPDGTLIAAGAKNEIHLWRTTDLEDRDPKPFAILKGNAKPLVSLTFNVKGDRLLSADKDRTVRIWDVAQQKPVQTLPVHPADVTRVAFNPVDGSMATASKDGMIRLWEPDGTSRLVLDEHAGAVNDIAFSADGKRLVSAGLDRNVIVWDVALGDIVHKLQGHKTEVRSIALHGERIASAGYDRAIFLWDAQRGQLLHRYPLMPHAIEGLAFRADGHRLAAVCRGQPIHVWDTNPTLEQPPAAPTLLLGGHTALVDGLAFSPAGNYLASVGRDGTMRLWNVSRSEGSLLHELPAVGNSMALCPNRPVIAVAAMDKNVHLWNWHTGERKTLSGHRDVVRAVAFANDGTLASAGDDGKMLVWDIGEGKLLRTLEGDGKKILQLEFHPGGHRLVSAGDAGIVQFWEAAGGRKLYQGPNHVGTVTDLAISADGTRLASAGADGMVYLCDPETGKEVRRFQDAGMKPASLGFSADGHFLAVGDTKSIIHIWNARTGAKVRKLEGHKGPVLSVAFSHSGNRLASAGAIVDGAVKLWDLTTGLELLTLRGHGRQADAVVFTPEDEALISLGRSPILLGQPAAIIPGQLRLWDAAPTRKK